MDIVACTVLAHFILWYFMIDSDVEFGDIDFNAPEIV